MWLLAFFAISQGWLAHTRFAAAEWRRFVRTGVIVAGVALAIFLLRTGDLLVAGPNWDLSQAKSLATLNQMTAGALMLASIVVGAGCVQQFIRTIRRKRDRPRTADPAS